MSAHRMEKQDIEQRLEQRGVKPTAMRLLVYGELEQARRPLSLRELEERMQTAERSTIFRTLTLLVKHHLIHDIEDGSGSLRYEVCHGHNACTPEDQHTHFFCKQCQRTFCLDDIQIPKIDLPEGFVASTVNYMIKGLCPECRAAQLP